MTVRAFGPAGLDLGARAELELELDEEESHYLLKVRRLRPGDALELFDGLGGAWSARLAAARGRRAVVEVGAALPVIEPPARVLLLGLPDQPATLEALTGASELGATTIVLVRCARSQGRVPSPDRLERVLRAAQRQCGRPRPVTLLGGPPGEPASLAAALEVEASLPGVFAWEALRGPDPHREPPGAPGAGLRLLVGPEGGLTPAEVEVIEAAGFTPVSLGPWILRTPTAVVALLARFTPTAGG